MNGAGETLKLKPAVLSVELVWCVVIFWLIFVSVLTWSISLPDWRSSVHVHFIYEILSTFMAFMIGGMALVRYYTKNCKVYLFLGTGFLGTALLDGFHAVATSEQLSVYMPSLLSSLIPWSWFSGRMFLSVVMFLSLIGWVQQENHTFSTKSVYGISGFFVLVVISFFIFFPLPEIDIANSLFSRPQELIAGIFFVLALAASLRTECWRDDGTEIWVRMSLVFAAIGQLCFMVFSKNLFDVYFDVAHLLKLVSYLCMIIGLMSSMYAVFIREQSSLKKVAESISESRLEERQVIIDNIQHGIAIYDQHLRLVAYNRAFCQMFDHEPDVFSIHVNMAEALNVLSRNFIIDNESSGYLRIEEQVKRATSGLPIDCRCALKNGKVLAMKGNAAPLGNYIVSYSDVTEIVTAEHRARQELQRLTEVFETSPFGIFIQYLESDKPHWRNSAACGILNDHSEGCPDIHGFDSIWESHQDKIDFFNQLHEKGIAHASDIRLKKPNGKARWCYIAAKQILLNGEKCNLYWLNDVTAHKEMKDRLYHSEKQVSLNRMVAGVAHEMSTPLGICITAISSIDNETDGLVDKLSDGKLTRGNLVSFTQNLKEYQTIISNNLLKAVYQLETFKRISGSEWQEKKRYINVQNFIESFFDEIKENKPAGTELSVICSEVVHLFVCPGAFKEIFVRLTDNTFTHGYETNQAGNISVFIERIGSDEILIRFIDKGKGIPANQLPSVMEPFFTTDFGQGEGGIGLSVVNNIITRKLKGSIDILSQQGKGVEVLLRIPLQADFHKADAAKSASGHNSYVI